MVLELFIWPLAEGVFIFKSSILPVKSIFFYGHRLNQILI